MTPAQLQTLRTAILADTDPAVVAVLGGGEIGRNDTELARLYNLPAAPDYYIWRASVGQDEIMQNGFDWVRVDNLSIGKARIWEWLFANPNRAINPQKPNVRAGVAECWRGAAPDLAVRQVVFGHCQRLATKAEKVFSTGAGTTSDVNGSGPGVASWAGTIGIMDIAEAMNG